MVELLTCRLLTNGLTQKYAHVLYCPTKSNVLFNCLYVWILEYCYWYIINIVLLKVMSSLTVYVLDLGILQLVYNLIIAIEKHFVPGAH